MDQKKPNQEVQLNINLDNTPILYTDNILMKTNEDGVVLNVCQKLVGSNQQRIVARIGMSRVHAKKFIKEMGKLLAVTEGPLKSGDKKN